jgi:hypothetical protein
MISTSDITTPPNLSYLPATLKYSQFLNYVVLASSSEISNLFFAPGTYIQTTKTCTSFKLGAGGSCL